MITIFDWFGYELPHFSRHEMIKQAGFDGVALWWSEDFGRISYREAPASARQAGLQIGNIHAPFESINDIWLDNLQGEALTDVFLKCVSDCAVFEIPAVVMHLTGGATPPRVSELGLRRINRIAEKAEVSNVNVAFENMRDVPHLDVVLDKIQSSRIGFCYDSGHHNCRNPKEDLLRKHGDCLMVLHLHDNDGTEDRHCLPFDGTIDWKRTMKNIQATRYNSGIALEVMNSGYEHLSPEEFLCEAYWRAMKLEELICNE